MPRLDTFKVTYHPRRTATDPRSTARGRTATTPIRPTSPRHATTVRTRSRLQLDTEHRLPTASTTSSSLRSSITRRTPDRCVHKDANPGRTFYPRSRPDELYYGWECSVDTGHSNPPLVRRADLSRRADCLREAPTRRKRRS